MQEFFEQLVDIGARLSTEVIEFRKLMSKAPKKYRKDKRIMNLYKNMRGLIGPSPKAKADIPATENIQSTDLESDDEFWNDPATIAQMVERLRQ